MTHDYNKALDDISQLNGRTFSSVDECDTIFACKLSRYMDEILSALTLATESKQLRKELDAVTTKLDTVTSERDDLARYIVDQNKALNWHDMQCIKGVNFKTEILAKKVNENGK